MDYVRVFSIAYMIYPLPASLIWRRKPAIIMQRIFANWQENKNMEQTIETLNYVYE